MGGGRAYVRDRTTSARLCAKNEGGGLCAREAYLRDTTVFMQVFMLYQWRSLDLKGGRAHEVGKYGREEERSSETISTSSCIQNTNSHPYTFKSTLHCQIKIAIQGQCWSFVHGHLCAHMG